MSLGNALPRGVAMFAVGTFVVSVSLYVAHLFLPVDGPAPFGGPNSTINGATATLACFVIPIPPLWPFAIGHLLFYGGSLLFLMGNSRSAARCALGALAFSLLPRLVFFPFYGLWHIGIAIKWLAMLALWLASAIRE